RLVSDACTVRHHAEAWAASAYRGAVDGFRPEVPVRDGSASSCANHRIAGEVVTSRQLLGRMLLRGCGALPPVNLAHAPGRAGRGCDLTARQSEFEARFARFVTV